MFAGHIQNKSESSFIRDAQLLQLCNDLANSDVALALLLQTMVVGKFRGYSMAMA